MGIDGLLALFKPIIKKEHIKNFRGKTLGVDALPWIYKGFYGANMLMGQQKSQHGFLYYILQMIDMLLFYNIKPIFIFDGRNVSAKNKTLQKRKKTKDQNKQKAEISIKNNDSQQGKKYLSRCITIDQKAIALTMNLLISKGVDFVVAPYEADCQIAKLQNLNIIDAAITQDSDLVVYGVKVILKLKQSGQCDYLDINQKQQNILEGENVFLKKFVQFDRIKKMEAAILAGCDYCESVKGIGLKKAINLIQNHENFAKIVDNLKKDPKLGDKVPQNYLQLIQNAKLIFCLATVFNPKTLQLQQLNPQLLDQLMSKNMTQEQLRNIIGVHYQFGQDHYKGKINCKIQQQRTLFGIDLKIIYSLNPQNIIFDKMIEEEQNANNKQLIQKQENSIQIRVIGPPQVVSQNQECSQKQKIKQNSLLDIYQETSIMQGDSICSQNQQILKTVFWNHFLPN